MKHRITLVLGVLSVALFGINTAFANTNARQEISTAILHADTANKSTDLGKIRLQLHHVINCLVGSHGSGFDVAAGDPCMGMGHGAINDFKADKVNRDMLKQALQEAEYGLMTKRIKIAQNAADLAEQSLKESEEPI